MIAVKIPVKQLPNQRLTTVVNNQTITIDLYQRGGHLYADVYLLDQLICGGAICNNACYINQYASDFKGYLFFYSTTEVEPNYLNIGITTYLYYTDFDILAA